MKAIISLYFVVYECFNYFSHLQKISPFKDIVVYLAIHSTQLLFWLCLSIFILLLFLLQPSTLIMQALQSILQIQILTSTLTYHLRKIVILLNMY
jgi:hypothetical protein